MKDDSARDKAMDKLVAKQLRARLKQGSESCPNAEILAAYVERTLSARERASCEAHLAGCLGCQALVAELVRLSEDDGPAEVQTAAESSARAAAAPRFRWAWAGSALAAILVGGLWYTGEFRNVLQQTPETTVQIRSSQPNKPAPPATTEYDNKVASPPASESRRDQENKSNGNKVLDQLRPPASTAAKNVRPRGSPSAVVGLGGTSAHRATPAQTQNEVTASTPQPAPAAPAADRFEPSNKGAIATPSERATLAKDGRAQGGLNGGSPAQGAAGGIVSGTTTNNPSANPSKNDFSIAGPRARKISPPSAPKAANEESNSKKSELQDEAKAKEQAPSSAAITSALSENDREKKQVQQSATQSVMVSGAAQQLEVQAEPATPQWRVGRRGLIQKRDANGRWRKQESGVKAHLNDIAFSGLDDGWAVGHAGTILRTTDGGATWTKLPSPTTEDLVHVTAIGNQEASVVTRGGQTFETSDDGKTWNSKQ